MMMRVTCLIAGSLLISGLLSGCSQSDSESAAAPKSEDALLQELLGNLDRTEIADRSSADSAGRTPVAPVARAADGERLQLNLHPGDRFPLIKTIEQTLIQRSEQYPAMAQTQLELSMAIDVQDVRPDAILLGVSYSRVSYSHDINGQRIHYDSDSHQGRVPEDVVPYAGMVNNGFSFWLGKDNQIRELVDYSEFLERCVQQVPLERRQTLLAEIAARFGDDGVASFVDDTIGLLPYNTDVDADSATRVAPGDVWTRERRLMQPVPIYLTSTYRLISLNDTTAEIDITGRIASGETYADANSPQQAAVRILGGQSIGHCIVDRRTGLPLELKRTRFLNMQVTTEDNHLVTQDKQIVTTIRAFPQARGPVVQSLPESAPNRLAPPMPGSQFPAPSATSANSAAVGSGIQPVSGTSAASAARVSPIPTTTNNAAAAYPE